MELLLLSALKAPCQATLGEATMGLSALKPEAYAPKYALSLSLFLQFEQHLNGNAMHAVRTQCARSAKFWMSANTRTLVLAPFDKFLVPYKGFLASQAFRTWHI